MIRRTVMRHGYWIVVGALSTAIGLMIGFMVIDIAVPELGLSGIIAGPGRPAASHQPPATPGPNAEVKMGRAILPGDAQCAGCHLSSDGAVGLRPMPVMGHPLEGWSQCTSCHAPDRLVETAPGHSGIHASECTVCHETGNLPVPLSRPHRDNQNVACLSCHGNVAPLPSDMAHRKQAVCWLCHRLPAVEPPVPAHLTAPGEADCLTCHVAGGPAGKLPADHVERPSSLCLSCHEVALGTTPGDSPRITVWPAPSKAP